MYEHMNRWTAAIGLTLSLSCFSLYCLVSSSKWASYIATLPSTYQLPICWTIESLSCLRGSTTFTDTLALFKHISRQYAYLHRALRVSKGFPFADRGWRSICVKKYSVLMVIGIPGTVCIRPWQNPALQSLALTSASFTFDDYRCCALCFSPFSVLSHCHLYAAQISLDCDIV